MRRKIYDFFLLPQIFLRYFFCFVKILRCFFHSKYNTHYTHMAVICIFIHIQSHIYLYFVAFNVQLKEKRMVLREKKIIPDIHCAYIMNVYSVICNRMPFFHVIHAEVYICYRHQCSDQFYN